MKFTLLVVEHYDFFVRDCLMFKATASAWPTLDEFRQNQNGSEWSSLCQTLLPRHLITPDGPAPDCSFRKSYTIVGYFFKILLCIVELTATSEPSTNETVQLELFPNPGQLDSYPVDMFSLLDTFRNSDGIIKFN